MTSEALRAPDARPIRVLVVDDSATVRALLSRRLNADPAVEVVGTASDGLEALERIAELRPDVVTLDIEMPRLDGLGTLKRIMQLFPMPVVMVSSQTRDGADATLQALELGAVDFIEKASFRELGAPDAMADAVSQKVRNAATARLVASPTAEPPPLRPVPTVEAGRRWLGKTVLIGSSTGGPPALRRLLERLPADIDVPILLVQHMPPGFTRSLADRLDKLCSLRVEEASEGARLEPGKALLAPGGRHMKLRRSGTISLSDGPPECGVRPSVNVTMESLVAVAGDQVVAAVLTGMGNDGTRGAGLIKQAGGHVIAEAESSCVVYGMPRAVVDAGFADELLPLDKIADAIVRQCVVPRSA